MIEEPTLFILGAGAHCPYGLPDGGTLYKEIIKALPHKPVLPKPGLVGNSLAELWLSLPGNNRLPSPAHQLTLFRNAMMGAGHPSIDAFLYEHRDVEGFAAIGRLVVPYILRPKEFKVPFDRSVVIGKKNGAETVDQDWMTYLFKLMLDGCNGMTDFFARNKVAFITFNYDRTLEHFFYTRLLNTFHLKPMEALAVLKEKKIEIQHVYGSFGYYDPEKVHEEAITVEGMLTAGKNIHLMYEDRGQNPGMERANQMLHTHYKRWVFLGFGFDSANIQVLGLNLKETKPPHISATRYWVPNGDWERCLRAMAPNKIPVVGAEQQDSLAFLRQNVWF
jgi:hypothetical protein